MRGTVRLLWWGTALWLLCSAAACSGETEIAREPAQAADNGADASTSPASPGNNGRTDSIGTSPDNGGAMGGDGGALHDGGSNTAGASANAGASGSGSAGTTAASPADAGAGISGSVGGGVGGVAGTTVAGSGGTTALGRCLVSGCSNTICDEQIAGPMITTCEFQASYACYATASCERQSNGQCGWTQTPELLDCLANARM